MYITAILAIFLAIVGNFLYGRNLIAVEGRGNKTSAWPWVIFTLLGLNDFLLFVFSPQPTNFEIFVGFLIFIGPLIISVIIIKQNVSKKRLGPSILDIVFFILTVISILSMTTVEILVVWEVISDWGDSRIEKYGFAVFVIFLDIVSVRILYLEIKAFPKDHEPWSWLCFLFAGIFATYHQIKIAGVSEETGIVPTIMIAENIFVASIILPSILLFQKKKSDIRS